LSGCKFGSPHRTDRCERYLFDARAPRSTDANVRFGSWSCENALAEALTRRDFGEVAMLRHFAGFGGFSVWKYS
jgi:hypothetical protein